MRIDPDDIASAMRTVRTGRPTGFEAILGDALTAVGGTCHDDDARRVVDAALRGRPMPANCAALAEAVGSTALDVDVIRSLGGDPMAVGFLAATLGSLRLETVAGGMAVARHRSGDDRSPRLTYAIDLGDGATWRSDRDGHRVELAAISETIAVGLAAEGGERPLADLVRHPLLDGRDLEVEEATSRNGRVALRLAHRADMEEATLRDLAA